MWDFKALRICVHNTFVFTVLNLYLHSEPKYLPFRPLIYWPHKKDLFWQIRSGEYEGLEEKLKKPEWLPDFGEANFVPSWGATVTGVRKFLIAYNINLVSTKEQAHRIALNLRSQGRAGGQPGRLKAVQGIGWWLAEKNIAQVSTQSF